MRNAEESVAERAEGKLKPNLLKEPRMTTYTHLQKKNQQTRAEGRTSIKLEEEEIGN